MEAWYAACAAASQIPNCPMPNATNKGVLVAEGKRKIAEAKEKFFNEEIFNKAKAKKEKREAKTKAKLDKLAASKKKDKE